MIVVSNDFKTAMTRPVKELQAYIEGNGQSIRDSDDLINFKVSGEGGMCKSVMKKLEAKYLGEHNLLGQWVSAGFGAKLASGAFEYLSYGSFLVSELTITKDTGETNIVAYDKMINAMKPYVKLDVTYPIDLLTYTRELCKACDLELGNVVFGNNILKNITSYLWRDNVGGVAEVYDNYIKVIMPETPTKFSGVYSTAVRESLAGMWGRKAVYSFYAKADTERTIMFQSVGEEGHRHINLTTEWQRFSYVVDNFADFSPTFYCGDSLDKTPYYIKDIMLEEAPALSEYKAYNTMNDWQITATTDNEGNIIDLWENIDGITYRDIFVQIAQATGSTCIIGNDDKVYFKPITNTGERLTYDNMFKLKLEDKYGEINSVVLSRTPQEDNVFLKNDASIEENGLTEFKIENNQIVDRNRENAIQPIFDALNGVSYYPFETTTEGLGWYEIGDSFEIETDTGDVFNTVLYNLNISVDGSLKETLKTTAESKTQTQYQYATSISKRIKNTEIIVDKQNNEIKSLVSDMHDEDGVVNEMYTQITQKIDNIEFKVQHSGGDNIIKDSVMFAYANTEDNSPWGVSGDGTLTIQSDVEAQKHGGLSGQSFTLLNKKAIQRVSVNVSTESNPTRYSFGTKIKKLATGNCYVKIYNTVENYLIEIPSGKEAFYDDYEIKGMTPKESYYDIEFYGSADSGATFTDNMLALGEYKSQWTQANGEIMNTQVNINTDGVRVNRGDGEYTVMSPTEFAGYSNNTRVFSLNGDVTDVSKLHAKDEVKMVPLKIVPVTEGDLIGWAFVPTST